MLRYFPFYIRYFSDGASEICHHTFKDGSVQHAFLSVLTFPRSGFLHFLYVHLLCVDLYSTLSDKCSILFLWTLLKPCHHTLKEVCLHERAEVPKNLFLFAFLPRFCVAILSIGSACLLLPN